MLFVDFFLMPFKKVGQSYMGSTSVLLAINTVKIYISNIGSENRFFTKDEYEGSVF